MPCRSIRFDSYSSTIREIVRHTCGATGRGSRIAQERPNSAARYSAVIGTNNGRGASGRSNDRSEPSRRGVQEPRKTLLLRFASAWGEHPEPTSSGPVQLTSVFASSAGGRLSANSNVFVYLLLSPDMRNGQKARNLSELRP